MKKYILLLAILLSVSENVFAQTSNKKFDSWDNFYDYFRTTKRYQGRSAYFNGIIEIKINDGEIGVYVGGKIYFIIGTCKTKPKVPFWGLCKNGSICGR